MEITEEELEAFAYNCVRKTIIQCKNYGILWKVYAQELAENLTKYYIENKKGLKDESN